MTVVTFEGNLGMLIIQAEKNRHSWLAGNSESGDSPASHVWWEGQGKLSLDNQDIVFNFETRKHRDIKTDEIPSLEEEFMLISGVSEKAVVKDKKTIVWYFLSELRDVLKNEEQKEDALPIVWIKPPVVEGGKFVEKGIIIEPGHQMELQIN